MLWSIFAGERERCICKQQATVICYKRNVRCTCRCGWMVTTMLYWAIVVLVLYMYVSNTLRHPNLYIVMMNKLIQPSIAQLNVCHHFGIFFLSLGEIWIGWLSHAQWALLMCLCIVHKMHWSWSRIVILRSLHDLYHAYSDLHENWSKLNTTQSFSLIREQSERAADEIRTFHI